MTSTSMCNEDSPEGMAEETPLNLDHLPDEALSALLQIELPHLCPAFGLMPDVACGPQLDRESLWERLRRVMDDPVQVLTWRGDKRVVHVLRHWVLVVWASGRITPLHWSARSCGLFTLRPVDPDSLNLFHLGSRSEWLAGHRDATSREHVQAHVAQGGSYRAQAPRLNNSRNFSALHPLVMDHVRQSRLDARIRDAFGLESEVLRWVLSMVSLKRKASSSEVTVRAYNWVVRQRQALETVKREAPQLLQWYAACARDVRFPTEGEPVQRLKRHLLDLGVGRTGWHLALKDGDKVWRQVFREPEPLRGMLGQALDLLKTHAVLGQGTLLPEALFDRLTKQLGPPTWGWHDEGAVLTHVAGLWRAQPPQTEAEHADWEGVLTWMAKEGVPTRLNAWQRRHGLAYLVRRANAWRQREEIRWQATLKPLYVWHEPVEGDGWRVVFMRTRRYLIEEGEAMGNCLANGSYTVSFDTLYARLYRQEEHLGTALFMFRDGIWHLKDALRRFNQSFEEDDFAQLQRLGSLIRRPVFNTGEIV
jgi:hypothetical protein